MTGDTLQEFDRLVAAGFSEEQARALVEVVGAPSRTDPEVMETLKLVVQRLDGIGQRLDAHGQIIEAIIPSVQMIPALSLEVRGLKRTVEELVKDNRATTDKQNKMSADLHVVGERVKMEGRVARMINLALIAIGATAASLLAVFAR